MDVYVDKSIGVAMGATKPGIKGCVVRPRILIGCVTLKEGTTSLRNLVLLDLHPVAKSGF